MEKYYHIEIFTPESGCLVYQVKSKKGSDVFLLADEEVAKDFCWAMNKARGERREYESKLIPGDA